MRSLTIVFHDAGGGHRNAAGALKTVLEEQDHPWNVRLLNLQELLDPIDLVQRATGHRLQDGYNLLLRKGWTRLTPQLLVLLQCTIRLHHARIVRILRNFWSHNPANLVLSVIPHFNACLAESIRKEMPSAAFVTVLTDLADYPPNFWIERESEYIVCGSEHARQQALSAGHAPERIFKTSGMVLKPSFYRKPWIDRDQERIKLGLKPELPTGIVMFGGHGSASMLEIAKRMDRSASQVQLIFLCGHNLELAAKIRNLRLTMPPVIVEFNSRTMPQERYNGTWLTEKQLGIVVPDFSGIGPVVEQLLTNSTLRELRDNVSAYENHAVVEVPLILDRVMANKAMESWQAPSTLAFGDPLANVAWAGLT